MKNISYEKRYGPATKFILNIKKHKGNFLPWNKTLENIRARCGNPKSSKWFYYGGKGVKCLITNEELKIAFFRDKAYLLDQPSVDRIDSSGNYIFSNIRWIEMRDNRKFRGLSHPSFRPLLKKFNNSIFSLSKKFKLDKHSLRSVLRRIIKNI